MNRTWIGIGLIAMLTLFGCGYGGDHGHDHDTAEPAGLTDADRAAIAADATAWENGAQAGDWAAVAALYHTDAILMPPNAPTATGRDAVLASLSAMPPLTTMNLDHVEVEGAGDWAGVRGNYSMTFDTPDGPVTDTGKFMEIRRRQDDGSWPVIRDIFNSDSPMAH